MKRQAGEVAGKYKAAKRVLEAVEKANADAVTEFSKQCDWDNPDDVSAWASARAFGARQELLDKWVRDRVCPGLVAADGVAVVKCGRLVINPRQWVAIFKRGKCTRVICRHCWSMLGVARIIDGVRKQGKRIDGGDLVKSVKMRYELDGVRITELRTKAGLTMGQFASLCGWSVVWQSKVEHNQSPMVEESTFQKILSVFSSIGVDCLSKTR